MMTLLPIQEHLEDNTQFTEREECQESIYMSVDFYTRVGYNPPWICYYASIDGILVGSAAYKGLPINNRVEIAYGVFPSHRMKGIGTQICQELVALSLDTDPNVTITARTLPEENYSTRILTKNGFILLGTINDPEDGPVWEWEYVT
jgi:RimJ/RimL family protein N-acetyltransferase